MTTAPLKYINISTVGPDATHKFEVYFNSQKILFSCPKINVFKKKVNIKDLILKNIK